MTHTSNCRKSIGKYLQCKVEGKSFIGFRQVVILHSNEDGFTGFSGQQKGCSIYRLKVACVDSLKLGGTSKVRVLWLAI